MLAGNIPVAMALPWEYKPSHRLWGFHFTSVCQTGDLRLGGICGVRLIRMRGVCR